ncbi:sulfotransferase [Chroococcidiopsis sp. CCMEE 29]|uniref:sulfotransferase family protein n=1 Tax=Chroococcidiopsis sp. CCMEE 29 TaxID=155894 RepID=UPI002022518F|nr:sulfotransferase [Chroococcidiopsis sp. CCMEE 29]
MPTSNKNKQSVLVVTAMPRSGTSFTASLLQNAGLDIGKRLMGPGHGNVKGFFENFDFVEFHEMVLRSQGLNPIGWTLQGKIDVQEQYVEKAKEIIAKNSLNSLWGWKDPRTTLFLDFWLNLLPDAKFLLIYRAPWEVVDSIYRRGDEIFLEQPELAVKIWMNYNQKILDFYNKFSERCLLVSVYSIANKTKSFIDTINTKFKLNFVHPKSDIYNCSLLQTQPWDAHEPTLVGHYFPQALDIYQELNKREVLLDETPDRLWLEQIKAPPKREWAFQNWLNIRNLEGQLRSLRAELERSQFQLQQTQAELEAVASNGKPGFSEED